MKALRAIATVAAGAWLGGMILIPIVAATTFGRIRDAQLADADALAGRVMAPIFGHFDTIQLVCAGIVLLAAVVRVVSIGPRRRSVIGLLLTLAASGLLLYSVTTVTPQILDLQDSVAGESVAPDAQATFDRFHKQAERIGKINLLLVFIIAMELAIPEGDTRTRSEPSPERRRAGIKPRA
jgi:hypothetical protein